MYVFFMSSINVICVVAFDLVGVFFNIVMLWSCFRLNNKRNTFVQTCKILAVCHCACQVMIVITDAVEWWEGFDKPRESCNIFRVLSICMMIAQAFNITVITIIYSYHRNQEVSSILKQIAGMHIVSAVSWWYSCLSQELLSQWPSQLCALLQKRLLSSCLPHLRDIIFTAKSRIQLPTFRQ